MIKAIKGTRDILPPSSAVWNHVERVAREVFRTFNYHEIRTPIFEETALFARGVGEDTDIVGKEMYTWEDRDKTSLTLRPENTASVMRAYIEHRLDQVVGVKKYYYMGPMFRRERPQKGRYRQFYQIGAEAIGSESPIVDAEVIEMVVEILKQVGLKPVEDVAGDDKEGFRLLINSVGCASCRPIFVAALKEKLRDVAATMCADCQRRAVTNPLRVLDCKIPEDQPIIETLPSILDYLCRECNIHRNVVETQLWNRNIVYEVRPRLVRGLDYYMRTTFEVTHGSLGAQSAVLGGGRYDGLAESLGSRVPAPGIGFSIGEDRLVMSVSQTGGEPVYEMDVFLIDMRDLAYVRKVSWEPGERDGYGPEVAARLRSCGFAVECSPDSRLKRGLELASKQGARFALILGENEINEKQYLVKNMKTSIQVKIPFASFDDLVDLFKRK